VITQFDEYKLLERVHNPFYKPAMVEWLEKMFDHSYKREWYSTYHAFDIHGVISRPDYRKKGKEFNLNYYPYAKETLQYLTKYRPDMVLFLHTSSYPEEIENYMEQFKSDGIHFKYINENPEISSASGCFGHYEKKPYFNSYFEDKAGFRPDRDWKPLYKYFINQKRLPDPNWEFKSDEEYHKK